MNEVTLPGTKLFCNVFIELVAQNPWDLCRFSEVLDIIMVIING